VVRDEVSGTYSVDESTVEFAARLREELGIGTDPARRPIQKVAVPKSRPRVEGAGAGTAPSPR
jgi:hypothetical protein